MSAKTKYDIEVTFAGAPDTASLSKFNEDDIDKLLTVLPKTKYLQGVEVIKALESAEIAKGHTKNIIAGKRLHASNNKAELELSSDKDRDSWVMSQEDVTEAQVAEIEAIMNFKLQEFKYTYYDDLFVSARKQANKFEQQAKNAEQLERYRR